MRVQVTTHPPARCRGTYETDEDWEERPVHERFHVINYAFMSNHPDEELQRLLQLGKRSAAHNHLRSRQRAPDVLVGAFDVAVRGLSLSTWGMHTTRGGIQMATHT